MNITAYPAIFLLWSFW